MAGLTVSKLGYGTSGLSRQAARFDRDLDEASIATIQAIIDADPRLRLGRMHAIAGDRDDPILLPELMQGFDGVIGQTNDSLRRACRTQHQPDNAWARKGKLSSIR
jgi:hypothetical protein